MEFESPREKKTEILIHEHRRNTCQFCNMK